MSDSERQTFVMYGSLRQVREGAEWQLGVMTDWVALIGGTVTESGIHDQSMFSAYLFYEAGPHDRSGYFDYLGVRTGDFRHRYGKLPTEGIPTRRRS